MQLVSLHVSARLECSHCTIDELVIHWKLMLYVPIGLCLAALLPRWVLLDYARILLFIILPGYSLLPPKDATTATVPEQYKHASQTLYKL